MSLVKHHDDACVMQPRESRDDYFRLASVSMAHRMFFLIGCMTAVEHYTSSTVSQRGAILFQNRQTKAR